MSQSALNSLPYIFDRPSEPLFIGRDDFNFDVPTDYWPDRYKAIAPAIQTRFPTTGGQVIPVQNVQIPDISDALSLGRHDNFSIFNPFHRSCAVRIIEILLGMPNVDQFLSACVYCRERVNPFVFVYAASVAILHRNDTRNVPLPAHVEVFPELYIDSGVITRAREEVGVIPAGSRMPIEVPRDYTASDLDPEHRVAYFREDIGINLHHWHWHLVFPFDGPLNIVNKDRRGELFYYMHQQILARYNFERFSNGLPRTKRFNNFREPVAEGYFPKLDSTTASRIWPARQPNTPLSDLNRVNDQLQVDIQDLERWRDRIQNAIFDGVVNDGTRDIPLTEADGINILGNIVEASRLSVNLNRYGDLHNMGHFMLACAHDPDNRFLESFGVMGDVSTAMRDPAFYTFHAFVDDLFQEYKTTLVPYTVQQLSFDGIRVSGVDVAADGARTNEFNTFWQQNDIDLSRGLDFTPRGSIYARLTHLQHAPFTYRIRVDNSGAQRLGTVRIFIAPRFDERGTPLLFRDQRGLFVELDRFTTTLRSGANTVERRSVESTVTIPYEQTFRNLTTNRPASGDSLEGFNYCGCGWPQHMLIAKGNAEGFPCDLFVMVTDNRNDTVQQTDPNAGNAGCDDAQSYCGLRNGRYPDRRAMGYPFDRAPRLGVNTVAQFLTSNMFIQNTTIRFSNRIVAALPSRTQGQGQAQRPAQPAAGQGTGTQQGQTGQSNQGGQSGQGNRGTGGTQPPANRPGGGRPQRPSKNDWYLPIPPDHGDDYDDDIDKTYHI